MKLTCRSYKLTCEIFFLLFSSVTRAQKCYSTTEFSVNATSSQSLTEPFKPPTGPLSNTSTTWTWNIATESYSWSSPNTAVRQALWLETRPEQNLLSPDLGYLGCGLIAHGLKLNILKQGQNDTGNCGTVFTPTCSQAFIKSSREYAQLLSGSSAVSIFEICEEYRTRLWEKNGVPDECKDAFEDHAWVEPFRT
ncbi:MAG: hypothetical protein Q9201_002029 [Fulgogasparrea decipioides]